MNSSILPPQPPSTAVNVTPITAPQTQQAVKSAEKADPTQKDPKKKKQPRSKKDNGKTLDIEV